MRNLQSSGIILYYPYYPIIIILLGFYCRIFSVNWLVSAYIYNLKF